jgi:hypothetical protein
MAEKPRITSIRRSGGRRRTEGARKVTLTAATRGGDQRAILRALQDRVAEAIEVASPRDVAALSRRMLDVSAELAKLDAEDFSPAGEESAEPFDPGAI